MKVADILVELRKRNARLPNYALKGMIEFVEKNMWKNYTKAKRAREGRKLYDANYYARTKDRRKERAATREA